MTSKLLSPEYALLGLLDHQSAHGYQLHQRLVASLGQIWNISLSQTYNILKRLEAQGFIQGEMQPQESLPDRRQFHLTKDGRQRFEDWLDKPSGCSVRAIRIEFSTRLYFAFNRDPQLAQHLIDKQSEELLTGVRRIQQTLDTVPEEQLFNRLGLELRIRQLLSVIDWLQECRQEIHRSTPVMGKINER